MKTKGIIASLKGYFDKDFRKKLKQAETLKEVVRRLEDKEKKLKKKLASTKSPADHKLIKKALKALIVQRKKAEKMLGS